MKAIPRLEIYTKDGLRAPADSPLLGPVTANGEMKKGDSDHPRWENPIVKSRIERLIRRLGLVCDNDRRIVSVMVGTQGKYGAIWGLRKVPVVKTYLHMAYQGAFVNKKLIIRNAGPCPFSDSRAFAEAGPYGL
jgi:hypothetical protein